MTTENFVVKCIAGLIGIIVITSLAGFAIALIAINKAIITYSEVV